LRGGVGCAVGGKTMRFCLLKFGQLLVVELRFRTPTGNVSFCARSAHLLACCVSFNFEPLEAICLVKYVCGRNAVNPTHLSQLSPARAVPSRPPMNRTPLDETTTPRSSSSLLLSTSATSVALKQLT
jgi:hypothetical protein